MKSKIVVAFTVVFSAILLAFSSNLKEAEGSVEAAGKCAIPPFKEAFQAASKVFVGAVKSERKEGNTRIFEFEVEKYWKGASGRKIEISVYETARYQAWFKVGGKYLVYAETDEDKAFRVDRCSRSRDASDAADDLKKLGKGKRPG
ncbi:MAG TPA: hypothetical protein VGC76_09035 [Pyrinomonadaceae bacterium]|jgi:hypothetical protein